MNLRIVSNHALINSNSEARAVDVFGVFTFQSRVVRRKARTRSCCRLRWCRSEADMFDQLLVGHHHGVQCSGTFRAFPCRRYRLIQRCIPRQRTHILSSVCLYRFEPTQKLNDTAHVCPARELVILGTNNDGATGLATCGVGSFWEGVLQRISDKAKRRLP